MPEGIQRINGRILSVQTDTDGSTVTTDAFTGASVLYLEDASDFHEEGGELKLHDGKKITYDSADMDADTVTLTVPLVLDVPDGTHVKTFPISKTRWASCEVFGFDDPLTVLIPHHYWPWLKNGARTEAKQELATIIFDGRNWVIFDVQGVAKPKLSDEQGTNERIFRYTAEGIGTEGYKGVKLKEEYSGTLNTVRVKSATAVTAAAAYDLLLNGTSVATMTIPIGSKFSPMVSIAVDFEPGDRLRVEFTTPQDSTPDLKVWVYATLDND